MNAFRRVSRMLDEALGQRTVPGAVVRVGLGQEVLFEEARGFVSLRPEKIPARPEAAYDVASVTKVAATASAACLLASRGRIGLDEPLGTYMPEVPKDKATITIRQLLSHTSGFVGWKAYGRMWLEAFDLKPWRAWPSRDSRAWLLEAILTDDLVYGPGQAFTYSDPGFIVLGELLARAAREPLDAFLARELFEPLGMDSTFFVDLTTLKGPPRLDRPLAPTEDCPFRGRILRGEVHDLTAWALGGVAGHAGLFSTASDLHRLASAWLEAWRGDPSGPFEPSLAREFYRLQQPDLDSPFGLGWDSPGPESPLAGRRLGPRARGHWGYTGCSLWIEPDRGLIVILLTNRPHPHDTPPEALRAWRPRFHDAVVEAAEEALR